MTRLGLVGATSPSRAEQVLGLRPGRLRDGYFICVLRERLRADAVQFAGHTNSSDGRHGLPADTAAADERRPRIHEGLAADGYHVDWLIAALVGDTRNLRGPQRIIKLVAVSYLHSGRPDEDYPPATIWAPQFILTKPHDFYCAAYVGPDAVARLPRPTPGFDVSIGETAPYDGRARLIRYLESA